MSSRAINRLCICDFDRISQGLEHYEEIGCRMYYQLHPNSVTWIDFCSHVSPKYVMQKVAKLEGKKMTFMILADGLQSRFQHESGSKASPFYQSLCLLADLSNRSGNLERLCCAATTALAHTNKRFSLCFLTTTLLDGLIQLSD